MITDEEFRETLQAGISLFNRHRFFAAHDKWEEAWQKVKHEKKSQPAKDPRRDFLHGLILLSVAYLHWRRRNPIGATRKFEESIQLLSSYPDDFERVRLRGARDAAHRVLERLRKDPRTPYRVHDVPPLAFRR